MTDTEICTTRITRLEEKLQALRDDLGRTRELMESQIGFLGKSIDVAKTELDLRLNGMNEMRAQLERYERLSLSRQEYTTAHESTHHDIDDLKKSRDEMSGKASVSSVYIGWAFGLVSICIAVFSALK